MQSCEKLSAEELVTENLGLVRMLAGRFCGRGIEYEELYSAGCVGLVKAANRFDESKGFKFSTYAVPVIAGEIKQLFRSGGSITVSRPLKELSLKAVKIKEELIKKGIEPRISQIAKLLNTDIEQAALALEVSLPAISLSFDNEGIRDIPTPSGIGEITDKIALYEALGKLSPQDRRLIELRYFQELSQSRVAEILSMTQVQVSRREKRILGELREKLG